MVVVGAGNTIIEDHDKAGKGVRVRERERAGA